MNANAKKKQQKQTAGARGAAADAVTPELEALLAQLRAGLVPRAAPAVKQQAATVCRLLLVALDTQPGQPMSIPGVSGAAPGAAGAAPGAPPPPPTASGAATSPAPAAPPASTQPPGLLDLMTTWAKQNLDVSPPPHEHIPYIGTAAVTEMLGATIGMLGGERP